jgi:hypothetical protein
VRYRRLFLSDNPVLRGSDIGPRVRKAEMLTTREVAAYIALRPATLKFWRTRREKKGPPYYRLHRAAIRYRMKDLERWLREHRIETKG